MDNLENIPEMSTITFQGSDGSKTYKIVDADAPKPSEKTDDMAQPVGVDEDGKLWTAGGITVDPEPIPGMSGTLTLNSVSVYIADFVNDEILVISGGVDEKRHVIKS